MAFHELSRDDRWAKPGHRIEPAGLLSTLTNGLYKVLVINEDKQSLIVITNQASNNINANAKITSSERG